MIEIGSERIDDRGIIDDREVLFKGDKFEWLVMQRLRCYRGKHIKRYMFEHDTAGLPPVVLYGCSRCKALFWEYGRKGQ